MIEDPRAFLEQHVEFIRRHCLAVGRRYGWYGDEVDDFTGWVFERLTDNDYKIIRQFRGEGTAIAFLRTVIGNLARDYYIKLGGKYRPAARVEQLGPIAIMLDRLINRESRPWDEAINIVLQKGKFDATEQEIRRIAGQLPSHRASRPQPFPAGFDPSEDAPNPEIQIERKESQDRLRVALRRCLDDLPAIESLIVQLRYLRGWTVRKIATELRLEERPLYRRIPRILEALRACLAPAGFQEAELW